MIRLFTTTTLFQQTVTTISLHNQISTSTTTSLQHLKSPLPPKNNYFLLLHLKFYEKQVSLIYKLKPLSYQFTSNITPRLPLHASQPTPPKRQRYCTTHKSLIHIKKLHKLLVHRRLNIRFHSALFKVRKWSTIPFHLRGGTPL